MKVLMLGWELPPHNSGGLGVACYHMCKSLAKKGVAIQFMIPYTADHSEIDFMDVVPVHDQDVLKVMQAGTAYESYRYLQVHTDGTTSTNSLHEQVGIYEQSVEKLVEVSEFDIIHAHDWLTFRAAMAAKRVSGKPLIVHIHSSEHERSAGNGGNSFVRDIEYQAMMMADRVVAVSGKTKNVLIEKYNIPSEKIDVVHNSINISDYEDYEDANVYTYLHTMKTHGYRVVTNIGRLTIQKGLTHLLEAAKIVVEHRPKTIFLIVGTGDQYEELIQLSADYGISRNVLFAGFQRGKAWRDAYKISDLFIMPSVAEPFGLTPLEAMRFNVPAMVSNQSGVSEVVKNVLKADYWDTSDMANQIVNILNSQGFTETLVANAGAELQRLTWDDAAHSLHGLYERHMDGIRV